jgi:hypothetical protein
MKNPRRWCLKVGCWRSCQLKALIIGVLGCIQATFWLELAQFHPACFAGSNLRRLNIPNLSCRPEEIIAECDDLPSGGTLCLVLTRPAVTHLHSKAGLTFFVFPVEIVPPYPSSKQRRLNSKSATEEVSDVSVLFRNHGISRRRGGIHRWFSSIGCKSFSQKERIRRNHPKSD